MPSGQDDLPLSSEQREIAILAQKVSSPSRHAVTNALRALSRAWSIRALDPEMAAFRAITAEEESATAIFHSVRQLRYEGAEAIKHHSHVHKTALRPFLVAVSRSLIPLMQFEPHLSFVGSGEDRRLAIVMVLTTPEGKRLSFTSPSPLDGALDVNGQRYDFSEELEQLLNSSGSASMLNHVRSEVNLRNRLLYAAADGIPEWQGDVTPFLEKRLSFVFVNLSLLLLIDPYPPSQDFVQQCVGAFVRALDLLPSEHVVLQSDSQERSAGDPEVRDRLLVRVSGGGIESITVEPKLGPR